MFLGLVRLDYCDQHRLLTPEQIGCQARKLTHDYEVNKFNYEMWFHTCKNYLEIEPHEAVFRKYKKEDPQKALEAAQQILNILYNLNETIQ